MPKAVIFDFDGTILDSMAAHVHATAALLEPFGVCIDTKKVVQEFAGVPEHIYFPILLKGQQYNVEELTQKKYKLLIKELHENPQPMPGVMQLIEELHAKNIPLAIGTGSTTIFLNDMLEAMGIAHYFGATVCADQVSRGKPHPETFLTAAKQLGVAANECVVLEDGIPGMQGAKDGGMKCVGISEDAANSLPADVVVHSLTELTADMLLSDNFYK